MDDKIKHGTVTGYQYWKCRCRLCLDAQLSYNKKWRAENPTKVRQRNARTIINRKNMDIRVRRNAWLSWRYGICIEQYEQMLCDQEFGCAICSIKFDEDKIKPSVDHNHNTGRVRGLLCPQCNFLLGSAKEDARLMNKAIQYLDNHMDTDR